MSLRHLSSSIRLSSMNIPENDAPGRRRVVGQCLIHALERTQVVAKGHVLFFSQVRPQSVHCGGGRGFGAGQRSQKFPDRTESRAPRVKFSYAHAAPLDSDCGAPSTAAFLGIDVPLPSPHLLLE